MKVLIIEDNKMHLQEMYAYLSQRGHEVQPEESGYRKLKQNISRSFTPGTQTALSKEAAIYIRGIIEDFNPDLVLVDYQLKENSTKVNGKRFIETFLATRNVIIVTGQPDGKINNELKMMTTQSKSGAYRGMVWKFDDLNEDFFKMLENEIQTLFKQSKKIPVKFE